MGSQLLLISHGHAAARVFCRRSAVQEEAVDELALRCGVGHRQPFYPRGDGRLPITCATSRRWTVCRARCRSLCACDLGKLTSTVRPPFGRAATVRVASWAVAMARTIDKPRPWWPSL